jgi:hypothetical protein
LGFNTGDDTSSRLTAGVQQGLELEEAFNTMQRLLKNGINSASAALALAAQVREFAQSAAVLSSAITGQANKNQTAITSCEPPPYAFDLVLNPPKYKFMYLVEFTVNSQLIFSGGTTPTQSPVEEKIGFYAKKITRPSITFNHDDVNMYGLRTKIHKSSTFNDIDISFYDDEKNNVMNFLLKIVRRKNYNITGVTTETDGSLIGRRTQTFATDINGNGVYFSTAAPESGTFNTSGLSKLPNYITSIRVYHITHGGNKVDIYTMANPHLLDFQLDELNTAEASSGTEVNAKFSYEFLNVETDVRMTEDVARKLTALQTGSNTLPSMYPYAPVLNPKQTTMKPTQFDPTPSSNQVTNLGFSANLTTLPSAIENTNGVISTPVRNETISI